METKANKINKSLARLTKKKKTETTRIRNEGADISTNLKEMKTIMHEYYEQLYANKLDKLDKMDKFLKKT